MHQRGGGVPLLMLAAKRATRGVLEKATSREKEGISEGTMPLRKRKGKGFSFMGKKV